MSDTIQNIYKNIIFESDNPTKFYYHGTNKIFKKFASHGGDLGSGIYFTPSFADAVGFAWKKKHAYGGKQQIIYKVKLNYNNPLDLCSTSDDSNVCVKFFKNNDGYNISKYARDKGYDAIIRDACLDTGSEIVVFDNKQIEIIDILDYNMRSIDVER